VSGGKTPDSSAGPSKEVTWLIEVAASEAFVRVVRCDRGSLAFVAGPVRTGALAFVNDRGGVAEASWAVVRLWLSTPKRSFPTRASLAEAGAGTAVPRIKTATTI